MHAYNAGKPVEATSWREGQFADTFRIVRKLGRGKHASVEEVEHLETEEHFAVKIHEKETAKSKQIDRMAREFQILRLLYHQSFIHRFF